MLARLVRELPGESYLYESKWDGFRCLAWRDGERVELHSRHGRPPGRYFPRCPQRTAASSVWRSAWTTP
jgi:ATP-dependent DNA ligase